MKTPIRGSTTSWEAKEEKREKKKKKNHVEMKSESEKRGRNKD